VSALLMVAVLTRAGEVSWLAATMPRYDVIGDARSLIDGQHGPGHAQA